MSYLLDTQAFLWAAMSPGKLSRHAAPVVQSRTNLLYVSVITFWEISLKFSLGKLELEGVGPEALPGAAEQMQIAIQPFDPDDAATYHQLLRTEHKDPFDRMIIWQCLRRQWTLISSDRAFRLYQSAGLKLLW